MKARKDSLIVSSETWMERLDGAGHTTVDGTGTFVDPQTIQVNGTQLKAERVLVATGRDRGAADRGPRRDGLARSHLCARAD